MNKRLANARYLCLTRELSKLSQEEVAKMLGCEKSSVSEIETGERILSNKGLARLSEIYGVRSAWLSGIENSIPEEKG